MERNGSRAADDALDLLAWLAEVQQRAERQAGCLEMVDALDAMRVVQCFHGLQLDQQASSTIRSTKSSPTTVPS